MMLGLTLWGCRLLPLEPATRHAQPDVSEPSTLATANEPNAHWGGFFPLDLDNRWHYTRESTYETHPDTGPPTIEHLTSEFEYLIVCKQTFGAHDYFAVKVTESSFVAYGIYLRQDRFGLYEADHTTFPDCGTQPGAVAAASSASSRIAPAAARSESPDPELHGPRGAAWDKLRERLSLVHIAVGANGRPRHHGPEPGELLRLPYPLHPGARWTIRDDPEFTARVEGLDRLNTPNGTVSGWRIRINSLLFGPNDRVVVWYGQLGYLGLGAHLELLATDASGNITGHVELNEREQLDDWTLAGAGD